MITEKEILEKISKGKESPEFLEAVEIVFKEIKKGIRGEETAPWLDSITRKISNACKENSNTENLEKVLKL